jgi:hypothetical protein
MNHLRTHHLSKRYFQILEQHIHPPQLVPVRVEPGLMKALVQGPMAGGTFSPSPV